MGETVETRCDIRVGTSGYDYPEWEGALYPRGLGRSEYLGAYSEAFDTLELEYPARRPSEPRSSRELMSMTRRPIDFSVRAGPLLTGGADPAAWREAAAELAAGLSPLAEAGRLCAALFSFPPSFRYRADERRHLDRLLREFSAFPLVVEFLNAEWLSSRVIEALKERGAALCSSDLPRIEGMPPESDLVTSGIAYVRFHGRNASAWLSGDARSRCEYRYPCDELSSWLPRLESMSAEAGRLRVFFVNRRGGGAPAAAKDLLRLAKGAKLL